MSMNLDWLDFLLSSGVDFWVRLPGFLAVDWGRFLGKITCAVNWGRWVGFWVRLPVLSTGVDVYESGLVGFFAVDWVRFLCKISCAVNWGRCL